MIIGCGWLGQQLIAHWQQQQQLSDWQWIALRRSPVDAPLERVTHVTWHEPATTQQLELLRQAVWLIAIAPGSDMALYQQTLTLWRERAAQYGCRRLILCSSTGIYAGLAGEVDESSELDLTRPRVAALRQAELSVAQYPQHSILRLAGLTGAGRHPGRFCQRGVMAGALLPVNLVDSAQIANQLATWLVEDAMPTIANLVHPEHPTKQLFYTQAARAFGIAPPSFIAADEPARVVVSRYTESQPSLQAIVANIKNL